MRDSAAKESEAGFTILLPGLFCRAAPRDTLFKQCIDEVRQVDGMNCC